MSHKQLQYVNVSMLLQLIIHSPLTSYVVYKIGCYLEAWKCNYIVQNGGY